MKLNSDVFVLNVNLVANWTSTVNVDDLLLGYKSNKLK